MRTKKTKYGKYLLGLDIGGTKCALVLGNEKARIFDKISFPTPSQGGWKSAFNLILGARDEILKRNQLTPRSIRQAGVSCGGPLDSRKGLILSPPNLPGWDRVPLVRLLQSRWGCPVVLENDANACALAEWKFGAGRGFRNIVFLTFGTGLGAGLILDGRLYRGTNGLAGEAGHLRLAETGPGGYGKKGSFEGFCSGGGIARMAQAEAKRLLRIGKAPGYCRSLREVPFITAKAVCEAADRGDKTALSILRESGKNLGKGLAILIDLLNPERIILGGIYSRCERFLHPEALKAVRKEALSLSLSVCRMVPSSLGEKIGDVASLAVALMDAED